VKILFAALVLLSVSGLAAPIAARAQTTTVAPPAGAAPPADAARARRQQQMSPADAARDQQLQVLEARTGNTSFGVEKGGPYRQLDKTSGSFTVRKFRALRGQEQERGKSRRMPTGARTHGQPLVHEHGRKKRFLLF